MFSTFNEWKCLTPFCITQWMAKQGKGDQAMEVTVVEPAYLNYSEAERFTGLHRVTIWRAVRRGELKASGGGRGVRFSRDELCRWMESR